MSEYGYRRVGRFIVPREFPKWYAITGDTPVTVTVQVNRLYIRRYVIRFATFREAVTRLTELKRKYAAFHWINTEPIRS